MRIDELYRNPAEVADDRQHIVDIIEDLMMKKQWDKIDQAAQIFAKMGYRDDKRGWIAGIPFSTNPKELNTTLADLSHQGDELLTKRLRRKLLELIDGQE